MSWMSWGDIFGHASYIVLATSYILTNIFWLRVLACVGIFLEVLYFAASGGSHLMTGIFWGVVFIVINVWQLYVLMKDRWSLTLSLSELWPLRRAFVGLDDAQIARLLRTGQWLDLQPADLLTVVHQPVHHLNFIYHGRATVSVADTVVGYLRAGDFAGEIAFLTGSNATATITADQPVRVLAFDRDQLAKLCKDDPQIAASLYQLLGSELAHKVVMANEAATAARTEVREAAMPAPTQSTPM
jgi:CRP-like cAMP-binding protein